MEPPGPNLRLMISFNGHIIPRPRDKTLTYVGGETRIFSATRSSPLSSLYERLSKTLDSATKPFTLKYQLPNEDLDSLISLSTNEDFENMVEEYDRIVKENRNGRIRVFLFPVKPESFSSIGSFVEASSKSEDWFLSILNGSDSGSVGRNDNISIGKEAVKEREEKLEQLVETTSSFGSGDSSVGGKVEDKPTCADLISPDSVSSESGTTNKMNPMMYADSQAKNHITTAYPVDPFQVQHVQETGYPMNHQNQQYTVLEQHQHQQPQYLSFNAQQQQQFLQPIPQYFPHHSAPYFPIYPPQQQQPIRTQTSNDQNTPIFFFPPGQALRSPHPNQEMNKTVYRTTTMPNPSQIQSQYANYLQIRHPSQSIPNTSNNYMYENSQVYYTQPLAPHLAAQYPNMALPPSFALSESSAPSSIDRVKHHSTSSEP